MSLTLLGGKNTFLPPVAMLLALSNPGSAASPLHKPVTVCEVLEHTSFYAGKTVVVVGRLSSNLLDGTWLSENGCKGKAGPGDSNWPYAIFLGCPECTSPPVLVGKLGLDEKVLQAKLNRLRQSTPLGYGEVLQQSPSGKEFKKIRRKESWAAVYGRVLLPVGNRGTFGAVRAKAELCGAEGGSIYIKDPDSSKLSRP